MHLCSRSSLNELSCVLPRKDTQEGNVFRGPPDLRAAKPCASCSLFYPRTPLHAMPQGHQWGYHPLTGKVWNCYDPQACVHPRQKIAAGHSGTFNGFRAEGAPSPPTSPKVTWKVFVYSMHTKAIGASFVFAVMKRSHLTNKGAK